MRRIFLSVTLIFSFLAAFAQNNFVYEPVLLTIEKPDGRFAAGDTVKVYGILKADAPDDLQLEVETDGKIISPASPVTLKKEEKTLIYSGVFNKPTAALVSVYSRADKKQRAVVGFVVDEGGFRPGFDAPADFEAFWAKQLKTMRKCKMKGTMTPAGFPDNVKKYEGKCDLYAFEVNMHEGRDVHGYLAMPKNADPKSLPIMICLHGAGYSRSNASNAVKWAAENVIAIDMNAHGYPDDQPDEYYKELGEGELKDYRNRKVVDHKSFYFRLMYLRAVRALDFATTLPEWDGKKIMSYGSSQGGAQSIAVAAIDKRVGAVVAHVPAVTDLAGHLQNHRGGWPAYDRQMKKGDNLKAEMAVLPYYDGAVMIQHTKAKLWIEAGLIDNVCPSECVIGAFNSCPSTDKKLYTFPYRPHSPYKIDSRVKASWVKMIDKPRTEEMKEWFKSGELPKYYNSYLDSKAKEIKELKKKEADGFFYWTDSHFPNNAGHAPAILNYLQSQLGPCKIFSGGDVALNADRLEDGIRLNTAAWREAALYGNFFPVRGNHDFTSSTSRAVKNPETMTSEQVTEYISSFMAPDAVKAPGSTVNYYYVDSKKGKIRYIVFDSTDSVENSRVIYGMAPQQYKWMYDNAIATLPKGWDMIFLSHVPLAPDHNDCPSLLEVASEMKTLEKKPLMAICGHRHADMESGIGTVYQVLTSSDCLTDSGLTQVPYSLFPALKKAGTVNEHTIDYVSISKDHSKIIMKRIGHGYDRVFNILPIEVSVGEKVSLNASVGGPVKWFVFDTEGNSTTPKQKDGSRDYIISNKNASITSDGSVTSVLPGSSIAVALYEDGTKEYFMINAR